MLLFNKCRICQIKSILWQQYTLVYLHVAEVCATKCGLHCEAVCNSHLAPHDNTCCRFLALTHTELTPTERELIRSLGQRKRYFVKRKETSWVSQINSSELKFSLHNLFTKIVKSLSPKEERKYHENVSAKRNLNHKSHSRRITQALQESLTNHSLNKNHSSIDLT